MQSMSPALIDQQMDTLPELYGQELPRLLTQAKEAVLPQGIRRIYAVGNGDSYHAALSAAQAFAQWTSVDYRPVPAYTFFTREMPRMCPQDRETTLVACISASGSSGLAQSILKETSARGLAHTLSVTGRTGCPMDQCAESVLSAVITEQGRSPGIRTYAASLCALLALAARMGGTENRLDTLAAWIGRSAQGLAQTLAQSRRVAAQAAQWDWPHAMVLGCDGLLGCAQFVAARLAEGCGVLGVAQELEEWCHVESMTYPLQAPMILLAGDRQSRQQAVKVATVARKTGRPVLSVCAEADPALRDVSDACVILGLEDPGPLEPLYAYIPGALLARALAAKLGRAMFLSDLPFSLF